MFILSDFENYVSDNPVRISEILKINKNKHNDRCVVSENDKREEKEVSFGEVLNRVMNNHK